MDVPTDLQDTLVAAGYVYAKNRNGPTLLDRAIAVVLEKIGNFHIRMSNW